MAQSSADVSSRSSGSLLITQPPKWFIRLAIAAIMGATYYAAVQLAFGLLTTDKVAVFWPASGLAAGILIVLGPSARWPVVIGVMSAVLIAHVVTAKPLTVGIVSSVADGVEVLVIAGLVYRFFGPTCEAILVPTTTIECYQTPRAKRTKIWRQKMSRKLRSSFVGHPGLD